MTGISDEGIEAKYNLYIIIFIYIYIYSGFMYEYGLGTVQDFPLAKRYYDEAYDDSMKKQISIIPLSIASTWLWVYNI